MHRDRREYLVIDSAMVFYLSAVVVLKIGVRPYWSNCMDSDNTVTMVTKHFPINMNISFLIFM